MTGLFDGLPGLLNEVFGSPVTWGPQGGTPVTLRATLRQTPVAVAAGDGGSVLVSDAVLRVPRDAAGGMRAGDLITLPSGQSWRIESRIPGGGPGIDHFVDFTLELA